MERLRIGVVVTGSFCTLTRTLRIVEQLVGLGHEVTAVFSYNVAKLDTRFFEASVFRERMSELVEGRIIDTIAGAEPIGPKDMFDVLIVLPCTGNTLAKVAHGITDTPATMAVKSHIRGNKPVLIALASNDGMGASYENIARLTVSKNFYFVPYSEDDSAKKPKSLVYREDMVLEALDAMLKGVSLPVFVDNVRR